MVVVDEVGLIIVDEGLLSAIASNSSLAEVRMGLLIEPTHMEDEGEEQERRWKAQSRESKSIKTTTTCR